MLEIISAKRKNLRAKRPGKPGVLGESMLLFRLVFVTNVRKDVEHFTQAVDGTEDDGHHYWYHDHGEYQTFQQL
jgi:hypothetical protein